MTRYWPLSRDTFTVSSGFGWRWGELHAGQDLAAPDGTPFYACQAGTVLFIGAASGYGQWIVIDSSDAEGAGVVEYGHMWNARATGLNVGDHVDAGQLIGYVGSNGQSTGPHLHVSVMPREYNPAAKIDPLSWLGQAAYPGEDVPMSEAVLFGVDISNYQKNIDIDQIAREGFTAIIAKASEGSDYEDPFYARNRDGARRNGLLFWGYHYLRAGDPVGNALCWDRAVGGDRSVACMLDWEDGGGTIRDALQFKAEAERLGYRVPITYTGKWYWQRIGSPAGIDQLGALMDSNYGGNPPGFASGIYDADGCNNWRSYGGADATLLQFTDRAQVAGRQVDAWAYRGTRASLDALINPPIVQPQAKIQEDEMTPELEQMIRDIHRESTQRLEDRGPAAKPPLSDTVLGHAINGASFSRRMVDEILPAVQRRLDAIEARLPKAGA